MACQTVSLANTYGFNESPSYSWAYDDTNPLARYNPRRWSPYLTRWQVADELRDLAESDRARPLRVQERLGHEWKFTCGSRAQTVLQAHNGPPANEHGFDEGLKYSWRRVFPAGVVEDRLPKFGQRAWSEYMSRSQMLAQLQEEHHIPEDRPVEIKMVGEEHKRAEYATVKEAESALQAPLEGVPDCAIDDLAKSFPHMDRCGISRILAKYDGSIPKARKEFFTTPAMEPIATASFADSQFLSEYRRNQAPQSIEELMQAVTELVRLLHECNCGAGQDHCREAFVKKLGDSIVPGDSVVVAAQRLWTSFEKNCAGRELCSMINQATRAADPSSARPVARVARAINAELVNVDTNRASRRPPALQSKPGFLGTCWRGGGLPHRHKAFFELHKGKKIRIPNYLATAFKDGEVVNRFLSYAHEDDFPCVKWEIELETRTGRCYCTHVNFIENRTDGLEDEHEFLFVPYSVFTIVEVIWSSNPTPNNPHRIKMRAAEDNWREEEDLPLAPWS